MLRIIGLDAAAVAALGFRPKLVGFPKQPSGIERRDFDVDILLGDQVVDDLVLKTEAGREHGLALDLPAKTRQPLAGRHIAQMLIEL